MVVNIDSMPIHSATNKLNPNMVSKNVNYDKDCKTYKRCHDCIVSGCDYDISTHKCIKSGPVLDTSTATE